MKSPAELNRIFPSGLRSLDLSQSPAEVARGLLHLPGLVFLDSSTAELENDRRDSRFSLIAARPKAWLEGNFCDRADRDRLRKALSCEKSECSPGMDRGFPAGGAIGTIDFQGAYRFGIYPEVMVFDHRSEKWMESGRLSESVLPDSECPDSLSGFSPLNFEAELDRDSFCRSVAKAQQYIAAGDIYQVNLSHRFRARLDREINSRNGAFSLFERLRDVSPAPYSAFFNQGDRRVVLSSSPELFLEMSGNAIRTRPIKGTRPRFRDSSQDEKSAFDLITSPKEIAELIMITDLERNDLGQICEFGSVRATDLLKLERYAQVFHLVSTIEGTLRQEIDHIEAMAACFPGGSITGAPKKRACEIIAELEDVPRGLYTGTIGIFGFNGESRFNIAIRTAVIEDGELQFHTGAGIVADSDPQAEYEETLHKAAGILRSWADAR